jgi:hypothetical protein
MALYGIIQTKTAPNATIFGYQGAGNLSKSRHFVGKASLRTTGVSQTEPGISHALGGAVDKTTLRVIFSSKKLHQKTIN